MAARDPSRETMRQNMLLFAPARNYRTAKSGQQVRIGNSP